MVIFWLSAAAMVAVAGAMILWPLIRGQTVSTTGRDTLNTELFRERLAELETEHRQGRLSTEELVQLRNELERTLLNDVQTQVPRHTGGGPLARAIVYGIAALLPVLAAGYYYVEFYRGEAGDWIETQARLGDMAELALEQGDALPPEAFDNLPDFARVLQAKLLRTGMRDPQGLFLLGVSYVQLQQPQLAVPALERAHTLAEGQPRIMLAYAQALMMANEGRLTKTSADLLHGVLRMQPDHQAALLLFGFGAFNSGAYEQAIAAWRTLLAMRDANGDSAQLLRNSIAQAEQLLAEKDGTEGSREVQTGPRLAVTVDLSPHLEARLTPDDTLFIFARAASGPPMPLAVVRQSAQTFPVQVTLDDSQAMMPAMKLSNFQQVVVGARISKAGNVDAQPGDLQGLSETLELQNGTRSVALVIDQVVQ